jgi:PD-(D/E)XK nuclease superfamily
MDSSELAALLQKARMYTVSRETTIFSIGGKGYFENPTSDMLAFFFDPHQVHGFKDLLLRSFFACLAEEPPRSMDLVEPPIREEETAEGKRIDLILIGDDWILAIENKIYHTQDNPFLEYERHLTTRFQGKKIYRAILSPPGRSSEPNWFPISYKNFVDKIYENFGELFLRPEFNKWHVFMREFLIHLENYTVEREMEEEKAKFVEDNYRLINQILSPRDQYHGFLQQKGLAVLRACLITLQRRLI